MDVKIIPATLEGTVSSIASKSDVHRLMICALLSDGPVRIDGVSRCEDIDATARCVEALGGKVEFEGRTCTVTPTAQRKQSPRLDCGESGSTLRFLLPVAAVCSEDPSFTGSGRLPERPIGELKEAMEANGAVFSEPKLPFTVGGSLKAGTYTLPGNVSSQYISGLLMALSAVPGESFIRLTSELQSESYVNMTIHTLKLFGADACKTDNGYKTVGRDKLRSPGKALADGDWSNAAFFLAAGALEKGITVENLNTNSVQGDKKVLSALKAFGAEVEIKEDKITVKSCKLSSCTIDLKDTPDLLPILAVVAAFADGKTVFTGGERLRLKESDRLVTTVKMLESMGGKAEITADGIMVEGTGLKGGVVSGENDHRIVMAAAVGASFATDEVKIIGAEAINKSYPDFFSDLKALGGNANVI